MKAYPYFEKRKVIDLNCIWDFVFLGDIDSETVDIENIQYNDRLCVPSAFDAMPAYSGKRGVAVYRTFVDITPGTMGQLYFQSVGMWCRIFVDGELQVEHHPSYSAFKCPIPKSDKKIREISVLIDNRYNIDRSPLQENFFDFYHYGGIFRRVEAYELADTFIDYCHVSVQNALDGLIRVSIRLSGTIPQQIDLKAVIDNSQTLTLDKVPVNNECVEVDINIAQPRLWDPGSPELHILKIETETDDIIVRFGLREIETSGKKIRINGKPVKLLGFCRHEAHPQYGPALPDQQLIADIQILKDLGCNFVRGAHYPQDQRFLDLCDEEGIMVFEESMGWGQSKEHFTNSDFVNAQLKHTEEMIITSFNHPSVIMWGFLNEGESNSEESKSCYKSLINLIRRLDPARLVTYASNRCQKDLFLDLVDVISFNMYPGWYTDPDKDDTLSEILSRIRSDIDFLNANGYHEKPFIISEIGAGAIYGWRDPLKSHWTEEYQAELQKIVCREVIENKEIAGISIWQFCDCRTYKAARALARPRGFNNKGVLDEYRRPKLAYEAVKRIFTSLSQLQKSE